MKIRSPYQCLAGCIWLARYTDKARLMCQGKLPPDYLMLLGHHRGVDGHFLRHFGLDRKTSLEAISIQPSDSSVEQWFRAQPEVTQSSIKSWNDLAPNLGRRGWPGEGNLAIAIERFYSGLVMEVPAESYFELILIDENLPLPRNDSQSTSASHPP